MDTSKLRRSKNVDDQTAAYYTLMTILRNPLRSQWMDPRFDPDFPGGRYSEQAMPQHMGQMRTFPVSGLLPAGPLSEQAGLNDLSSGSYRRD